MRQQLISALAASLIVNTPAIAGPDEATRALMSDSVSLLDWGLLRMEIDLSRELDGALNPTVSYDWESDEIRISLYTHRTDSIAQAHALCETAFRDIRNAVGINPERGEPVFEVSRFALMFSHSGFARSIDGKNLEEWAKDIDPKITITFQQAILKENETTTYECSGDLLDTGFTTRIE